MRKFFLFTGVFILFLVAVVIAVPFVVDVNNYKGKIEQIVLEKTHRELHINGPISLRVFPSIALKMKDVTLGNPPGFEKGEFATFDQLVAMVKLKPLLNKEVKITKIELVKPIIHLIKVSDDKVNWDFNDLSTKEEDKKDSDNNNVSSIDIDEFTIENGDIHYSDKTKKKIYTVSGLDVNVTNSLVSGLEAHVSLDWNDQKLELDAKTSSLDSILADKGNYPLNLDIKSPLLKLKFEGNTIVQEKLALDGKLDVSSPSVAKLKNWLLVVSDKPDPDMNKPLSLGCLAHLAAERVACKSLALSLAGITLNGDLSAQFPEGKKTSFQGNIHTDSINLDTLMGNKPATATPGSAEKEGDWKQKEVRISGLDKVDGSLRFSAGSVIYRNLKIGKVSGALNIKNQVLSLVLSEVNFYGGMVKGNLDLNQQASTPSYSENWDIKHVALGNVLKDYMGNDRFSGTLDAVIQTKGVGKTYGSLMSSGEGNAHFSLRDGFVRGINLAQIARTVTAPLSSDKESAKTDFSEAHASFVIHKGIAHNEDMTAKSPFILVKGSGDIDLGREWINYLAEPSLIASTQGQGRLGESKGLTVPVRIEGPWADPHIRLEIAQQVVKDLLADPANIGKTLKGYKESTKGLGKSLKSGILGGLGGSKEAPADATQGSQGSSETAPTPEQKQDQEPKKKDAVKDLLNMF
ncbi:MAG: AsmA family protein [Alphaproteobacteria bacterium]|nr:AsmA family protein [Alphaproteobacteria bacterium]